MFVCMQSMYSLSNNLIDTHKQKLLIPQNLLNLKHFNCNAALNRLRRAKTIKIIDKW